MAPDGVGESMKLSGVGKGLGASSRSTSRELPVAVDTKFIERNTSILGELIPRRRFRFREKQPLVRLRLLDETLAVPGELPFNDFAVPVEAANKVKTHATVALVIENELTFLDIAASPECYRRTRFRRRGGAFGAN